MFLVALMAIAMLLTILAWMIVPRSFPDSRPGGLALLGAASINSALFICALGLTVFGGMPLKELKELALYGICCSAALGFAAMLCSAFLHKRRYAAILLPACGVFLLWLFIALLG